MFEIDFLSKCDISRSAEIEKKCLDTAWSENQISNLPDGAVYLVAREDGEILGIASMYCVFDEGQIMNIAVDPNFRRRGIGKALLELLCEIAFERKCVSIVLEVALDNENAILLYEKCGFEKAGKRKGFFVMVKALRDEV